MSTVNQCSIHYIATIQKGLHWRHVVDSLAHPVLLPVPVQKTSRHFFCVNRTFECNPYKSVEHVLRAYLTVNAVFVSSVRAFQKAKLLELLGSTWSVVLPLHQKDFVRVPEIVYSIKKHHYFQKYTYILTTMGFLTSVRSPKVLLITKQHN